MGWIGPTDARYDEQRALFSAMIDKRPRVIAACETPADIRSALDRARDDGLEVAVRSGGHAVAGQSTNDDGIVIDVRAMTCIEIDATARRARVGGGCTWADFDAAAQQHGLATTGGRVSTTGVAGLTLGASRRRDQIRPNAGSRTQRVHLRQSPQRHRQVRARTSTAPNPNTK